jgi:chromosome transmission fidelity protein 18
VLDQEYQKNLLVCANAARQARYHAGDDSLLQPSRSLTINAIAEPDKAKGAKRDFFGRVVEVPSDGEREDGPKRRKVVPEENKVWVSFHEGFSNAVRKPVTLAELMRGL